MIKEYIRLIISDLKMDKKFFILLTIQTIIAFIVIGNICGIADFTTVTLNSLDSFNFSDNYYGKISTEIYTTNGIFVSENDMEAERNLSYYIAENFKTSGFSYNTVYEGENAVNMAFAAENSFDVYNIEVESGRLFLKEEYGTDTMADTPVILGNYFKDEYKVGDLYCGRYKVVGILKKGQQTINLAGERSKAVTTDAEAFFPVKSLFCMKENHFEYPSSLIYAENKSQLKAINDYANELCLYPFNFISLGETKQIINDMSAKSTMPMLIISSIIIVLAIFCLVQSSMLFIRRNITELLIHRICGAKLSAILFRVSAASIFIVLTSGIVTSLIFRTLSALTGIIITGVIVLSVTIIPFAIKLRKISILSSIREGR